MFRIIALTLALTAMLCSMSLANVEINDQAIVDDLTVVQNEIDSLSAAIMSCMDTGKQHQECMCDNEEKLVQFSKTVQVLFEKHPELTKHDLIHYRAQDGAINNQSLVGIKKQANMELSCD